MPPTLPIETYDYIENKVKELFAREEDITVDEFVIPYELETTIEYILQDFNMLKERYNYTIDQITKSDCVTQGCLLISGLLLYEFED